MVWFICIMCVRQMYTFALKNLMVKGLTTQCQLGTEDCEMIAWVLQVTEM